MRKKQETNIVSRQSMLVSHIACNRLNHQRQQWGIQRLQNIVLWWIYCNQLGENCLSCERAFCDAWCWQWWVCIQNYFQQTELIILFSLKDNIFFLHLLHSTPNNISFLKMHIFFYVLFRVKSVLKVAKC